MTASAFSGAAELTSFLMLFEALRFIDYPEHVPKLLFRLDIVNR